MKPPPLLLGAALIFWGWQSDLLLPGVIMALTLESARFVHTRWDLADEDFSRIWTFCGLLLLAAAVYAFASTEAHRISPACSLIRTCEPNAAPA